MYVLCVHICVYIYSICVHIFTHNNSSQKGLTIAKGLYYTILMSTGPGTRLLALNLDSVSGI